MSNTESEDKDAIEAVERMEPYAVPVDIDGSIASIAISLKRIADLLDGILQVARSDARRRKVDPTKWKANKPKEE